METMEFSIYYLQLKRLKRKLPTVSVFFELGGVDEDFKNTLCMDGAKHFFDTKKVKISAKREINEYGDLYILKEVADKHENIKNLMPGDVVKYQDKSYIIHNNRMFDRLLSKEF